jgi:hypothetical protein
MAPHAAGLVVLQLPHLGLHSGEGPGSKQVALANAKGADPLEGDGGSISNLRTQGHTACQPDHWIACSSLAWPDNKFGSVLCCYATTLVLQVEAGRSKNCSRAH